MKVIITGATGLVGSAVARHCIANPKISGIFILTRRAPAGDIADDAKVTVVIHEDFTIYPPDLLAKLAGAEACLWAIGGRVSSFPDVESCRRAHVDFATPAARAFATLAAGSDGGKKFRFVFCSGKYAEWDQNKKLLFLQDSRRIKGEVEKALCDIADENDNTLEVWCLRPSGILPAGTGALQRATGKLYGAVGVEKLAEAMARVAIEGHPRRIIENGEILKM